MENEKKYASLETLRSFKENADKLYATQENVDAISSVLDGCQELVNDFNADLSNLYNTKADKSTTLSGYGVTDAYTKNQVDSALSNYLPLTGGTVNDLVVTGEISVSEVGNNETVINSNGIVTNTINSEDIKTDNININNYINILSDKNDLNSSPVFGDADVDTYIYAKGFHVYNNDDDNGDNYKIFFPAKSGIFALTSDIPTDYETKTDASSKLTEAKTYADTNLSTAKSYTDSALNNIYTKSEIDNMELITVDDIDAICGATIQVASMNEVTF